MSEFEITSFAFGVFCAAASDASPRAKLQKANHFKLTN